MLHYVEKRDTEIERLMEMCRVLISQVRDIQVVSLTRRPSPPSDGVLTHPLFLLQGFSAEVRSKQKELQQAEERFETQKVSFVLLTFAHPFPRALLCLSVLLRVCLLLARLLLLFVRVLVVPRWVFAFPGHWFC